MAEPDKLKDPLEKHLYLKDRDGNWIPFDGRSSLDLTVGLTLICETGNCGGTNTFYSPSFRIDKCGYFGVWIQCSSLGTINVNLSFKQSFDPTFANFVTPEGVGTVLTIADSNPHVVSLAPIPMPFILLTLVGVGSNDASTRARMMFFAQ
jgi:hypothetical protein